MGAAVIQGILKNKGFLFITTKFGSGRLNPKKNSSDGPGWRELWHRGVNDKRVRSFRQCEQKNLSLDVGLTSSSISVGVWL